MKQLPLTLLFLLFLGLKLGNVIDWSWWWVFAPLWAPVSVFVLCAVSIGTVVIWQDMQKKAKR